MMNRTNKTRKTQSYRKLAITDVVTNLLALVFGKPIKELKFKPIFLLPNEILFIHFT